MSVQFRVFMVHLLTGIFLSACLPAEPIHPTSPPFATVTNHSSAACPETEPAWVLPPEDSAVLNPPAYGYYYVNDDRSIWASAYWPGEQGDTLRAGEKGNKAGWFRPEGAALEITGRRLDGESPAFEAHIPCCYPTRFQATGLYFPTEGCWEITAKAADSLLSFVVWVEP